MEINESVHQLPTGSPDDPVMPSSELEMEQKWEDLRNQAAIAAMQGIMNFFDSIDFNKETIAKWAVGQADALIKELKKK